MPSFGMCFAYAPVNRVLINFIYLLIYLFYSSSLILYLINSVNMNNLTFLHFVYLKVNFAVVFIIINTSFNT